VSKRALACRPRITIGLFASSPVFISRRTCKRPRSSPNQVKHIPSEHNPSRFASGRVADLPREAQSGC
jgi:hypothetical protein